MTAFGGVGQVANTPGQLAWSRFHPAGGAGLRVLVSEENTLNVRRDMGFAPDARALYFNVLEAF